MSRAHTEEKSLEDLKLKGILKEISKEERSEKIYIVSRTKIRKNTNKTKLTKSYKRRYREP